jgi:hypothetical protein
VPATRVLRSISYHLVVVVDQLSSSVGTPPKDLLAVAREAKYIMQTWLKQMLYVISAIMEPTHSLNKKMDRMYDTETICFQITVVYCAFVLLCTGTDSLRKRCRSVPPHRTSTRTSKDFKVVIRHGQQKLEVKRKKSSMTLASRGIVVVIRADHRLSHC